MSIDFKYVPLTFISTRSAIEEQLKNTIVFKKVLDEYQNCLPLEDLIISTQYGYTASAKNDGTHKLLRITDINNGKVNWDTVPMCDCDRPQNYILNEGDVLIARTGNNISFIVDKTVPNNSVFASYLIRIICDKNKILPEYLYLFLNSYAFWPQILLKQRGALLQNVNASLMKQLLIPMCSLQEQKEIINKIETNLTIRISKETEKIISLFDNKNDISSELDQQLDHIKQLRQAFLREAMQGKLVKSTNIKETGQQLLEKIKAEKAQLIAEKKLKKEKELPAITEGEIPFEIPEHWVWCRLGEICNKVTDGFHHTPKKLTEGKIYISATHIKDTGIKWDECLFVSEKDHLELYKKASPQKGEILITNRGAGCGTPAIIDINDEFSFQNTALIGFNQLLVNNKYVYNFILKSRDEIMAKFVNGGLQPMLSNIILKTIPFPLPPLHEQEQIVTKLDDLMAFCDGLEQSIKESQGYNEKLLQQVLREALQGEEVINE
jgi:type I restriction enzyme S subunit